MLSETEDVTFETALSSGEGKIERAEKYHVPAEGYNTERTNQGKHCKGRTPMQTFLEDRCLVTEKDLSRLTVPLAAYKTALLEMRLSDQV